MAKTRRKRHTYTAAQRTLVLNAARKEGLTAAQVERKFGVTPVTYYSWRKKLGAARTRGSVVFASGPAGARNLTSTVRLAVAKRVREILPEIVRSEVGTYLDALFAGGRSRRRGHLV